MLTDDIGGGIRALLYAKARDGFSSRGCLVGSFIINTKGFMMCMLLALRSVQVCVCVGGEG